MEIEIVKDKISLEKLVDLTNNSFGNLVKGVVDVEEEILALGGELHADEEEKLIKNGSKQENLWGINLYPEIQGKDWVEFDSMINIRPRQNNKTRGVDDEKIRERIIAIVNKIVQK